MWLPDALARFFFAPAPRTWSVVGRVGLGVVLFFAWFLYAPMLGDAYGPDGLWGARTLEHVSTPLPPLGPLESFAWLRSVRSFGLIVCLYVLLLLSALSFAAGFLTRTSGLTLALLHVLFVARQPTAMWGWSLLVHAFVLYVVAADPGRAFSVDALLRQRRNGAPWRQPFRGPAWPLRLLQIHLCCMYATAGYSRFDRPMWLEGDAVFEALHHLTFGRFPFDLAPFMPVLVAMTYCAFVLEPAAVVLLWIRRTRTVVALLLVGLHVGLELLTTVGWWNFVMILALCAFLPERWLSALVFRSAEPRAIESPSRDMHETTASSRDP